MKAIDVVCDQKYNSQFGMEAPTVVLADDGV